MRLSTVWAAFGLLLSVSAWESEEVDDPEDVSRLLPGDFVPPQAFKNINLVRNTNLEKGYIRETINVVVENIDSRPQAEYYVPFEYDVVGKVGGFEVRDKKNADKGRFNVRKAALEEPLSTDDTTSSRPAQYFIAQFPKPLAPKEQITLSISYHVLGSLRPLPAAIKQDQKQYLSYSFSAYWPSAYTTVKQKTKLKFPTADIPDYTETTGLTTAKDPEKQGSSFTYGPYETEKIPPGVTYPVLVRYEFARAVVVATTLERDIEVSHWGGNLATEERYWLRNGGADLKGNFDRVMWTVQNFQSHMANPAIKEIKIPLRPGSADPYFTDEIGNVSTSHFRPNKIREASLELQPRYPIFGGWKYNFRVGWNNDLGSFVRRLKSQADTYLLSIPLLEGPKLTEGIAYEHLDLRVILPEGATHVRWETHGGSSLPDFTPTISLHKTFMDTVGRTELKLSAINVADEARDITLLVTYQYSFSAAYRKPVTMFFGFIAVFVAAWLVGQIDTSIGKKKQL